MEIKDIHEDSKSLEKHGNKVQAKSLEKFSKSLKPYASPDKNKLSVKESLYKLHVPIDNAKD